MAAEARPPDIRLGTSSFSHESWRGVFYEPSAAPKDYLPQYARHFDTVEIDATFYATPAPRTVQGWRERTPPGFLFAAKCPKAITHEKLLERCEAEIDPFLEVMAILGDKLGPILVQLPALAPSRVADAAALVARLDPFLARWPRAVRVAVEVRNRAFVGPRLLDCLGRHGAALAVIDRVDMPAPAKWIGQIDPVTTDFSYIRWLGDRHGIERITKSWDRVVIDRGERLAQWAEVVAEIARRAGTVRGYFNNHYAGHAPASLRQLRALLAPPPDGGSSDGGGGHAAGGR